MNENDIKQIRLNITKNLINFQKRLFNRDDNYLDYNKDYQLIQDLKEILDQITMIKGLNPSVHNSILGGEFRTSDAIGKKDAIKIPLYLYLETINMIIDETIDSSTNLISEKREIETMISLLKIRLTTVRFNPIFKPGKHFSENAKQAIIRSRGNFYFKEKEFLNKKYIWIDVAIVTNANQVNPKFIASHEEILAFKEDEEEIHKNIKSQEEISLLKLKNELAEYFRNNTLPNKGEKIQSLLKDQNLDQNLKKMIIEDVAVINNKRFSYKQYEDMLTELCIYKKLINDDKRKEFFQLNTKHKRDRMNQEIEKLNECITNIESNLGIKPLTTADILPNENHINTEEDYYLIYMYQDILNAEKELAALNNFIEEYAKNNKS